MSEAKQRWLIQLVQTSHVKQNYQYLPYAAGLLQAYTIRYANELSRYVFLPILLDYKPIEEAVSDILLADVFAFSTYVWSYQYNLTLAKAIKARKPEALIIFGGPQVPDHAEDFLRQHPWIDVCVHGEGERTFFNLLESLPEANWSEIAGISWLDSQGIFQHHPQALRQKDLDTFPSPYLMGLFDELVKKHNYYWVALWESNRGCPFSCTFCDWGSNVAAKVRRFGLERVRAEIDWFAEHKIFNVTGCDANFGLLPRDLEIADYFVEVRQRTGYPKILFVQGAKNTTERSYQVNKKIIQASLGDMVTISLQSLNPVALKSIRRDNISLEAYRELQRRCNEEDINTYTDFLVGLPGETYDTFADGIEQLILEGQHHLINLHNVYVLPNAELNQPEYRQKYGIRTVKIPHHEQSHPVKSRTGIQEWQEVVIGADSFTPDDWVKMRVLAWWVEIVYVLRKLVQIPLMLMHMFTGIRYREIFEFYAFETLENAPILSQMQAFLLDKAASICRGETEFCVVQDVKEPFWVSTTDFIMTGLSRGEIREAFYQEQQRVMRQLLSKRGKDLPPEMLEEALSLSLGLANAFAAQQTFALTLHYNLWEITTRFRRAQPWQLRQGRFHHIHDWVGPPYYQVRVQEEHNAPLFTRR